MRQDYILRLIEQLIATLQIALGYRQSVDPATALRFLDSAMEEMLGLRSALANGLPIETVRALLSRGERLDVGATVTMALLLQAEGEVYETLKERDTAFRRFSRAAALLLAAEAEERDHEMLTRFDALPTLLAWLAPYELPPELLRAIAAHHERAGRFAAAEDALWAAHAAEPEPAALRAFYRRLLALPDALLAVGGLPRAEIEEGLAELG